MASTDLLRVLVPSLIAFFVSPATIAWVQVVALPPTSAKLVSTAKRVPSRISLTRLVSPSKYRQVHTPQKAPSSRLSAKKDSTMVMLSVATVTSVKLDTSAMDLVQPNKWAMPGTLQRPVLGRRMVPIDRYVTRDITARSTSGSCRRLVEETALVGSTTGRFHAKLVPTTH